MENALCSPGTVLVVVRVLLLWVIDQHGRVFFSLFIFWFLAVYIIDVLSILLVQILGIMESA